MNLLNILRAAMFCLTPDGFWGLPLLLWGEPGIGKSALVRQLALMFGLDFLRMSPAEQGEGRFGVVPVPGSDGLLHYPPPADVVSRFSSGRGMLFVDEISTAPPALQAPLLGMVQFRNLGAHTFPNGVRVLGAANEARDAAGGWDLSPPLCNRFGHLNYTGLEADDWAGALLNGFRSNTTTVEPAQALEERVLAAWPAADAQARGLVGGFIARNPALLHKRPAKGSNDKAWPSRRTCEYASIALASATVHGLNEQETDELIGAFVGTAWVTEFRQWAVNLDLPLASDVLDGKVKFSHDERRPDRTVVVLGSCAAFIGKDKNPDRIDMFFRIVADVAKVAPDFTMSPMRAVLGAGIVFKPGAQAKILSGLLPMLKAAGLT